MNQLPSPQINMDDMTPSQIVEQLNKYIIGQDRAKRIIAVALRNRTRRKRLGEGMRDEVFPKNIIMIGSTGVGKTEIARRIAKLSSAPFIKVEATKYTEVGYVGRDVESIIRDLMASAISLVKNELASSNTEAVNSKVEERLLDALLPNLRPEASGSAQFDQSKPATRESFRQMLREGLLEDREVEIDGPAPKFGIELAGQGGPEDLQNAVNSLGSIFGSLGPAGQRKKKKVTVKRAREIFREDETDRSVDKDKLIDIAKERTEQMGIVFIDEIDKIAGKNANSSSPDISREGVQRDILPIVEGSKVNTKWGVIDTTHILFIAAGAFSVSKPSDLIPELQGRFPLRVELSDLKAEDFYRILTEPENAITLQYIQLLKTEDVNLIFTDEALHRISEIAYDVNCNTENIGARRLYTVMETLLEDLSFNADKLGGQSITITPSYVDERLGSLVKNLDLSRYIL